MRKAPKREGFPRRSLEKEPAASVPALRFLGGRQKDQVDRPSYSISDASPVVEKPRTMTPVRVALPWSVHRSSQPAKAQDPQTTASEEASAPVAGRHGETWPITGLVHREKRHRRSINDKGNCHRRRALTSTQWQFHLDDQAFPSPCRLACSPQWRPPLKER